MPRVVRKHALSFGGKDSIAVPENSIPVHIEAIGGRMYIWFEQESPRTDCELIVRTYDVIGDEFEIPEDGIYIGSSVTDGEMTWHVYEINPPPSDVFLPASEAEVAALIAGELSEPINISKDTYETMLQKISPESMHAIDQEQVKHRVDGTVDILVDARFMFIFDMLANAFSTTPERILRDIMGMKPN